MRYQSTPEKEFDGDIIITDPCYIIRNENGITKNDWHYCEYGEYMERLGIKNYLTHDTIYGDWGCTVFDSDTKKPLGRFCADAGLVSVYYIDVENMILRKGSVSAQAGERLLIPINMRDGSLLCTGRGNEDWNFSAPHGAGRLMSRSAAKETFTVSEFKKQMEGIYTTSVGRSTLDECPMAYKGMDDIVNNVEPTVTIDAIIKPIYNFKAGEEE